MLGWLALAMACGIAFADATEASPIAAWPLAAVGLLFAVRPNGRLVAALALASATGLHAQASRLAEARDAAAIGVRERFVTATVTRRSAPWNPHWIELGEVRGADVARLRVYADAPDELDPWLPGDRLRARLRIGPLQRARNPGDAHGARRSARAGLGATASAVHPALVVAEGAGPAPTRAVHAMRRRVAQRLHAAGPGSDLLRGLALGDREAIADARRDAFVRLGLAHALAVSGLHLAWVVAASYALSRAALRRSAALAARIDTRRLALLPALTVGLGYAALAGWGIPTQRALALLLAAGLAIARRRPERTGVALGAAALWILAREPGALFEPGAQLSFGAVAAFVWAPRSPEPGGEETRVGWLRSRAEEALRRSATAILATAPLLAWHGGGVSSVALLANWVALPWLGGVVLPGALVAGVAVAFEAPGSAALASGAAWLADATGTWLAAAASGLPALQRPAPPAWVCLVVGAWALLGLSLRRTAARVAVAFGLAVLLAFVPAASVKPGLPRLAVLDVGQGDAALVQARRGALLVDAGGAWSGWDSGARRVLPALRALGVTRLDLVVATHADLDHRGGLPAVLRGLPTRELWLPFGGREDPDFAAVLAAARDARVRVREVGRGSPKRRIGGLEIDPLWPPRAFPGTRNARSLAVRVAVDGGRRVLFPGDLDAAAEARLVAMQSALDADIVLLAHHGSRGSNTPAFLDAVSASWAIASAPCRSRFGMPHREIRSRLAERATPLAWTGRDGALLAPLRGPLRVSGTGKPAFCP